MNAAGRQPPGCRYHRDAATTGGHGPRGPHSSRAPTPDCPVGLQRRKSGDHGGRQCCSWQGEPPHERRVAGLAPTPNCPANTARASGRPISGARPPARSLASTPAPRRAGGIGQAPRPTAWAGRHRAGRRAGTSELVKVGTASPRTGGSSPRQAWPPRRPSRVGARSRRRPAPTGWAPEGGLVDGERRQAAPGGLAAVTIKERRSG